MGPRLLPGALGDVSHSPRCLEEEMGTGWSWESVLTGLDCLSDQFSNSSCNLQVGTLGVRGVREAPAQSDPATGLWVPTPRLPCWPPSAGRGPQLTSSSAPREGISRGIHVTVPLRPCCFPGFPGPFTKYLSFDLPQALCLCQVLLWRWLCGHSDVSFALKKTRLGKGKTCQHLLPKLLPPDTVTVYLSALAQDTTAPPPHANDRSVSVSGDLHLDYPQISSLL